LEGGSKKLSPPPPSPLPPLIGPLHVLIESSQREDSKYIKFIEICTCRPKVMLTGASCPACQNWRYGKIEGNDSKEGAEFGLFQAAAEFQEAALSLKRNLNVIWLGRL